MTRMENQVHEYWTASVVFSHGPDAIEGVEISETEALEMLLDISVWGVPPLRRRVNKLLEQRGHGTLVYQIQPNDLLPCDTEPEPA